MIIRRIAAPKLWKLARKTKSRYIIAPKAGPHAKERCFTLGYILRDMLGVAGNAREALSILNSRIVKVDGCVRRDIGFPVGIMDVLTIGGDSWRLLPGKRELELKPISGAESNLKLLKIVNKTHVAGKTQLNFHDGRNMLVDKDVYKTADVVVYDIAERALKSSVQFKRGALVLVTKGDNCGKLGRVEDIVILRGSQPNRVVVKCDKEAIETLKAFVFAVGQDRPLITL